MDIFLKLHISKSRFCNRVFRTKVLWAKENQATFYYDRINEELITIKNEVYKLYKDFDNIDGYYIVERLYKLCIRNFTDGLEKPTTRAIPLLTTKYKNATKSRLLYICNQLSLHTNSITH